MWHKVEKSIVGSNHQITNNKSNSNNQQKKYNNNNRGNDYKSDKRNEQRSAEPHCWKCRREDHDTADCKYPPSKDKDNRKDENQTKHVSAIQVRKKVVQINMMRRAHMIKDTTVKSH